MAITTPGWQKTLLAKLGAPATAQNLRFVDAWQRAEGGRASNNPFNTTQPGAGASNYNSVGVKNYPSFDEGIGATVQTLLNGRYGNIVNLLRSGKASAQQEASAVAQSPWGTGSGVLRVLGSGSVPAGALGANGSAVPKVAASAPTSLPSANALTSPDAFRQLLGQYMLQQSQQAMSGNIAGAGNGLLQMVALRNAFQNSAALPTPMTKGVATAAAHVHGAGGPAVTTKGLDGSFQMQAGGKSPYSNLRFDSNVDWSHVNPRLLKAVNSVASSHGVVVDINSGYRSNAHSLQVGGFAGDPHTKGVAIDAYVHGRPIGSVIPANVWSKYGVQSGAVPNFYHGQEDPEHLQI